MLVDSEKAEHSNSVERHRGPVDAGEQKRVGASAPLGLTKFVVVGGGTRLVAQKQKARIFSVPPWQKHFAVNLLYALVFCVFSTSIALFS
jgi:hypothetical protein